MKTTSLMDSLDRVGFNALVLVHKSPDAPLTVSLMAEELDVSSYKLRTALKNINNDFQKITDDPNVFISETTPDTWEAHGISSLIVARIRLLYIQRGPLYSVFEYLVFFENQMTPNEFLNNSPLSRAGFYRKLDAATNLMKANLETDDSNAEYEFQNRLTLFQLYYRIYNGFELPFPELNELVDQIIDACSPYFIHPLRTSQHFKLSIFLRVWILRHKNSRIQLAPTLTINDDNTQYHELFTSLTKILGKNFALDHNEMTYLYGFLLAKNLIQSHSTMEINTNFPLATTLTDDLIEWIKHFALMDNFTPDIQATLHRDLLNVNLQVTSFYIEPTTFVREQSIQFFKRVYPSFDILIMRFLDELKDRHSVVLTESNQVNIYYGYMFALINNTPAFALRERVYVAVDFSQGDLYTQYVINSLDAFHHANLIIESNLTENTDIYISDIYSTKINLPQLVWEDPPTSRDWVDLADEIENVRSNKASALFAK